MDNFLNLSYIGGFMRALTKKIQSIAGFKEITIAFLFSIVIALFSKVAIYLPFTPVPLLLQNTLCLSLGLFLGKRVGALSVFFFLIEGMLGLPVFAGGGATIAYLLGPTGGYLIGYLVGSYLTGMVYERKKDTMGAFLALGTGSIAVYLFGFARLSLLIGGQKAFLLGVLPFLATDFLKIGIVAKGLEWTKKNHTV